MAKPVPILAYASRRRRSPTGWGEVVVNTVVIFAIITVLAMILAPIRSRGDRSTTTQCQSNLRQIALGCLTYESQNGGAFPQSIDQLATLIPAFSKNAIYTCPLCAGNPRKPPVTVGTRVTSNYVFCPPPRMILGPAATRTVLAYEPLSNHDGRGSVFVFCDGHALWFPAVQAKAVLTDLAAGRNPPPSLD